MPFHFFSSDESAAPGYTTLLKFWDREPRQLRSGLRYGSPVIYKDPNDTSQGFFKVERAIEDDAVKITNLWNEHYNQGGWSLRITPPFVIDIIRNGTILIIKHEKIVIASFVCRVLTGGVWCGKPITCGLLDGFVIHNNWRKKGLGSLLLAKMDMEAFRDSRLSKGLLMYFREIAIPETALSQAPINISRYFVCKIAKIIRNSTLVSEPLPEMVAKIVGDVYDYILEKRNDVSLMSKETTDKNVKWFLVANFLIGIADTHRWEHGEPVYEVVFCSEISRPYFTNRVSGWKHIQQAATHLPTSRGLLYASNSLTRGWLFEDAGDGWTAAGGYLSCHVYNWMPPRFMDGVVLFPHSCI